MTGEQLIERYRLRLVGLRDDEKDESPRREALDFILANWAKFEPTTVAHLRRTDPMPETQPAPSKELLKFYDWLVGPRWRRTG